MVVLSHKELIMKVSKMRKHIKRLIEKASAENDAGEALKYAEAAVNVANA